MATAAANTERLDYLYVGAVWSLGGLLVEPTETNFVTDSENMANWGPWNVTLSLDAAAAPDGNMTADVLTENTATDEHLCSKGAGCDSGIPVRYGIFIKDDGAAFGLVRIYDYTGTGYNTYFDFSTGKISSADAGISVESVRNVGNGWYRIIVVYNPVGTGLNLVVGPTRGDGQESYPGDGTSGIIAWGGSFTTSGPMGSYIPNTASEDTTTRAADAYSFTLGATVTALTFTFDDGSTQVVTGLAAGSSYTIPTNLNRRRILFIDNGDGGGGGTTWNDADRGFDIVVSGNVISKTGGSWETARTTTSHATGRWYFEMVMSEPGGDIMAGIANASSSVGWYVGSDTNGASYYLQGSDTFNSTGTPAPSGTPSARVGFDVDLDLKQSRYTVDGVTYSPWYPHPTMAAGPYFSSGSLDNRGSVAGYWSAADMVYAVPPGSTPWDGPGDTGNGVGGAGMQGLVEIYLIGG